MTYSSYQYDSEYEDDFVLYGEGELSEYEPDDDCYYGMYGMDDREPYETNHAQFSHRFLDLHEDDIWREPFDVLNETFEEEDVVPKEQVIDTQMIRNNMSVACAA
jgi:hypothetical protein